jgi:hypothetical protein
MTNTEVLPAVIPTDTAHAVDSYRVATNAATLCAEIVKATATKIQGKKYVQVEGWLSIAAAHGCLVSIAKVEKVDGGISATAELRRHSDGLVLATAEGFVGDDERTWANRPMYARRAMAQTRASSRVCRSAFAHVVVLIDRDLGTTPAEEMQGVIEHGGDVDGPGSSWGPGGKQSAVEEAERDGLTEHAPAEKDSDRRAREAKIAKCRQKVDDAVSVFKMVGQSAEVLHAYWDRNAEAFDWIEERLPDEYKRLRQAFDDALDGANARAA